MTGLLIILYTAVGGIVGFIYFVLLLGLVRLQTTGATLIYLAGLHVFRILLAVTAFWFIAQHGALALLAALLGFMLARLVVQRRVEGS